MKIKKIFSGKNLSFVFPVLLVMAIDFIFTMVGQPAGYWSNHVFLNEGSPLGIFFLSRNPLFFVLFFILYLLFVFLLIIKLKRPFNIIAGIGFFLGHVWGSSTWIPILVYRYTGQFYLSDWYFTIGYLIFISAISGIFINQWFKSNKSEI
jgi:hypothetical protein